MQTRTCEGGEDAFKARHVTLRLRGVIAQDAVQDLAEVQVANEYGGRRNRLQPSVKRWSNSRAAASALPWTQRRELGHALGEALAAGTATDAALALAP